MAKPFLPCHSTSHHSPQFAVSTRLPLGILPTISLVVPAPERRFTVEMTVAGPAAADGRHRPTARARWRPPPGRRRRTEQRAWRQGARVSLAPVTAPVAVAIAAIAVIAAVAVAAITVPVIVRSGRDIDRGRTDRDIVVSFNDGAGHRRGAARCGARPGNASAAVERGRYCKAFLALPLDLAPVGAVGGVDQAAAGNLGDDLVTGACGGTQVHRRCHIGRFGGRARCR